MVNFCEYRWDGIFASHDDIEIKIEDSEIEGSGRGVRLENDVTSICKNSIFKDNFRSISAYNYTQTGSFYNNSRWKLFGTLFSDAAVPLNFHPLSPIPSLVTNSSTFIFIDLDNSKNIQIGKSNKAVNVFSGLENIPIMSTDCNDLVVENYNFLISSTAIQAFNTKMLIGGLDDTLIGGIAYGNHFASENAIKSEGCYQEIGFNTFLASHIEIKNPNAYLNGTVKSVIMDNNIHEYSNVDIFYLNRAFTADVIIYHNEINNGKLNLTNINTVSLNNGVIVEHNEFQYQFGGLGSSTSNLPQSIYSLNLMNTPGIRVGDNHFSADLGVGIGAPPIPIPNNRAGGIHMVNVTNAQIKSNDFDSCHIAIFGEQDLSGTLFCNNFMHGGYYGMYYKKAILSNQGTATHNVGNGFFDQWINTIYFKDCLIPSKYYTWGGGNSFDPTVTPGMARDPGNPLTDPWQQVNNGLNGWVIDCGVLNKTDNTSTISSDNRQLAYPNPFTNELTIDIQDRLIDEFLQYDCFIIDFNGRIVFKTHVVTGINTINPELNAGVYFIRVIDGFGVTLLESKIVKL